MTGRHPLSLLPGTTLALAALTLGLLSQPLSLLAQTPETAEAASVADSSVQSIVDQIIGEESPALLERQSIERQQLQTLPKINRHYLNSSLQLTVTPRGQQRVQSYIDDILGFFKVDISRQRIEPINWTSDSNYDESNLPVSDSNREMFKKFKNIFTNWLVGFNLNPIKPVIYVADSAYRAQIIRMTANPNQALLKTLNKQDGVVLDLHVELSELDWATDSFLLSDKQNPFLGEVGFRTPFIKLGSKTNPIKMTVPLYVRSNANGIFEFKALTTQHNLEQSDIEFSYEKLVAPKIAIEINDKRFEFNQDRLNEELQNQLPEIYKLARNSLADFANKQLPDWITDQATRLFNFEIETISQIEPLGYDKDLHARDPLFSLGLRLQQITQNNFVNLQFRTFVEDPKALDEKLIPELGARGNPYMGYIYRNDKPVLIPASTYDMAISVDRGLINRLLDLSLKRGYLKEFEYDDENCKPQKMGIVKAPSMDYVPTPAWFGTVPETDTFFRVNIAIQLPANTITGWARLAVNDRPRIEVNLVGHLKLVKDKASSFDVKIVDIDTKKYYLYSDDITWLGALFKWKINDIIETKLSELSTTWRKDPIDLLAESDPNDCHKKIPKHFSVLGDEEKGEKPNLIGIPIKFTQVGLDPKGHILIYMDTPEKK